MGASLTAFDFQQPEDCCFSQGPMCHADVSSRSPGSSSLPRVTAKGATMKTKMKDDLEDIPMAYLWYVVLAIMAIVATAVAVVIRLF
jgi:hypothetical protein